MRTVRCAALLGVLLMLCVGCAGHDSYLHAKGELNGPISLTPAVYDGDGRLLSLSHGLREVAPFKAKQRRWSLMRVFHGASWDITNLVNRRLEETGGDAVVDLKVTVRTAPWQGIAMFLVVLPTYFDVYLDGKIVEATE